MTRHCEFIVYGQPIPKGSMRAINHKATGKAIAMAANRDKLKPWEARVSLAAREAWKGEPLHGPMQVSLRFQLARPAFHYGPGRNRDVLKKSAPTCPIIKKNGIDKLVRAVLDGLTGVVFGDDGQVVILDSSKYYGDPSVYVCVASVAIPGKESK